MASLGNTVTATLRLKGQQAFGAGMRGAESSTKRLGSGFSTMGKAAKVGFAAVGVGAAAGIAVLTREVAAGLTSLERIDRIHRQSLAAIKSTGGVAGVTAQQMEDLGTKIEGLTGSEQETTQMGQNMLLTFTNIRNGVGKGNDIFNQASMAMVDMGRAMDKTGDPLVDLNKTAIQLGKALNDPVKGVTALSKVGVSFDATQKKTIKGMVEHNNILGAQKIILGELNKEFGGSAKAFGGSLTGRIERVKHAYGTMQEQIASAALPTLEKVTNWALKKGIPLMGRFGNWALPKIQQGFRLVSPYVRRFVAFLSPLAHIFARNDVGQISKGVDSFKASLQRNSPWLKAFGQELRTGLIEYGPTIAKVLGKVAGFNTRALVTGLGFAIDGVKYLSLGFIWLSRTVINTLGTVLHASAKAFGWVPGLGDKLKAADKSFADFRKTANAELDKVQTVLTLTVDTRSAEQKLAGVGGISFEAGSTAGEKAQGRARAAASAASAKRTDIALNVDGRDLAKATDKGAKKNKAWR